MGNPDIVGGGAAAGVLSTFRLLFVVEDVDNATLGASVLGLVEMSVELTRFAKQGFQV